MPCLGQVLEVVRLWSSIFAAPNDLNVTFSFCRRMSRSISAESFYAKPPAREHTPQLPSNPLPLPQTPISLKTSGCDAYDSGAHLRPSLNKRLAMETEGHYSGAMPVSAFINQFFPSAKCPRGPSPPGTTSFATVISNTVKIETDMYDPFVRLPPFAQLNHVQ